jgi:hypothetical protein
MVEIGEKRARKSTVADVGFGNPQFIRAPQSLPDEDRALTDIAKWRRFSDADDADHDKISTKACKPQIFLVSLALLCCSIQALGQTPQEKLLGVKTFRRSQIRQSLMKFALSEITKENPSRGPCL